MEKERERGDGGKIAIKKRGLVSRVQGLCKEKRLSIACVAFDLQLSLVLGLRSLSSFHDGRRESGRGFSGALCVSSAREQRFAPRALDGSGEYEEIESDDSRFFASSATRQNFRSLTSFSPTATTITVTTETTKIAPPRRRPPLASHHRRRRAPGRPPERGDAGKIF